MRGTGAVHAISNANYVIKIVEAQYQADNLELSVHPQHEGRLPFATHQPLLLCRLTVDYVLLKFGHKFIQK